MTNYEHQPIGVIARGENPELSGQFVILPLPKLVKEEPLGPWRLLDITLTLIQVSSAILASYGTLIWLYQAEVVVKEGYPSMFTAQNQTATVKGLWFLAIAYFMSAFEWALKFMLTSCLGLSEVVQNNLTETHNTLNVFRVRQFGYMVGDILVAFAFMLLATDLPSVEDRQGFGVLNAFGVSESMLDKLVPEHTHNTEISRTDVGVQAAYMISNSATANIEFFLLIATIIRLVVLFIQITIGGEGLNVFYWLPFCRCSREYRGPGEGWSIEQAKEEQQDAEDDILTAQYDSTIIPLGLSSIYRMGCCTKPIVPGSKYMKHKWRWLASFSHNHRGAFRAWLYLSTILLFFGALQLRSSVVGPPRDISPFDGGHYFWPAYWPSNTSAFNKLLADASFNFTDPIDPVRIKLQEKLGNSTVFPRSIEDLDPLIGPGNDAGARLKSAIEFFAASEMCRLVSALAYLLGSIHNEASIAGNHIFSKDVALRWLCP
jgi:hypothetical protein